MKVLVTGYSGFIGSNLVKRIENEYKDIEIYKFNSQSDLSEIEEYTKDCDFVFHFAAVHRPKDVSEFGKINHELTSYILEYLEKYNNKCPFLYTSSVQAGNGSEYGVSKIKAENEVLEHAKKMGSQAIIYRLTNTFGVGARPNGHSVVATFCYNLQNDLPILVNDREHIMNFYYVGDVVDSFIKNLFNADTYANDEIRTLTDELTYKVSLGRLADTLYYFKKCQDDEIQPELQDKFEEKLLETYNSYRC